MKKKSNIKRGVLVVVFAIALCLGCCREIFADAKFSVSPMNQKIVLNAGEDYKGTFNITNPNDSENDFKYVLSVKSFFVDDKYDSVYDQNNGDYNQIVEWITLDKEKGVIRPNSTETVHFTVHVPENAPAGGQYAAITVTSDSESNADGGINLNAKYSIAHIIYAEVTGITEQKGEIKDLNVPGFLFDGKISGTSTVKNLGNVHGTATYKLQVFPLFSDEEVYTNEEKPDEKTILPERERLNTIFWEETPSIGIYNVVYTVEFEGQTQVLKKMVIVCPVWLLLVILFVIFALVFWLIARSKMRKKKAAKK